MPSQTSAATVTFLLLQLCTDAVCEITMAATCNTPGSSHQESMGANSRTAIGTTRKTNQKMSDEAAGSTVNDGVPAVHA